MKERYSKEELSRIKEEYGKIKGEVSSRIEEFKETWKDGDDEILKELVFCILTPQSKAKVCWKAVEKMDGKRLLNGAGKDEVLENLKGVRFKYKKSGYVAKALERFNPREGDSLKSLLSRFNSPSEAREYLVKEVKGLGYKEGSHFLRNVRVGLDLAILDRHIIRNLNRLNVIEEIPKTLTKKKYLVIEEKMREFSEEVDIPLPHLDLLLWYLEAGEVFK